MSGSLSPRVVDGATGDLPRGVRIGIAVAKWNESITRRLLAGALHTCGSAGVVADVIWVPGSFELPLAAHALAATRRFAAVLCLGAIIKGETSHDHHIATAAAAGIESTARHHGLPVIFGVLTCDTLAQAMVRAGGDLADGYAGNKGAECAVAAVEMIRVLAAIRDGGDA
jgi:6,7-dimethyl-8-ribityllumazine synthase